MSDEPNDRAARLAGRWGGESDEEAEGDDGGTEGDVGERDDGEANDGRAVETESDRSEDQSDGGEDQSDGGDGEGSVESEGEGDGETYDVGEADRVDDRKGDDEPSLTTREMQSQMLYLPPEFHKEIDLTFEELNLRFRRERDRKLEKNKDFYAGLLRLGLERLGDVRERELDEVEELLDL